MVVRKKLGILGGMGPEATILMFRKIVDLTPAKNDQDHIEIFIHNNTHVPDRTEAIMNQGTSPLEVLERSGKLLCDMGSDIIIIPCMTSHHFIPDLQKRVDIPIINAIEETVLYILKDYPDIKKVGILSTNGTMKSQLFQKQLEENSLSPVIPPIDIQERMVMNAIYGEAGIKAGYKNNSVKNKLIKASEHLIINGAAAIIAGCTEIPLVLKSEDISVPLIDPMDVLAKAAIRECLGMT